MLITSPSLSEDDRTTTTGLNIKSRKSVDLSGRCLHCALRTFRTEHFTFLSESMRITVCWVGPLRNGAQCPGMYHYDLRCTGSKSCEQMGARECLLLDDRDGSECLLLDDRDGSECLLLDDRDGSEWMREAAAASMMR